MCLEVCTLKLELHNSMKLVFAFDFVYKTFKKLFFVEAFLLLLDERSFIDIKQEKFMLGIVDFFFLSTPG